MSDYIERKVALDEITKHKDAVKSEGTAFGAGYSLAHDHISDVIRMKVPAADVWENPRGRKMASTKAIAILSDDLQHLLWAESSITEYKGWFLSNEQYEKELSDLRDAIEAHKMAIRKLGGATV